MSVEPGRTGAAAVPAGVEPTGVGPQTLHVVVDGRADTAPAWRTVAAHLLARGITSWRSTRHGGRPRGLFCGIGVCFDCLVDVNGVPDVRACQRILADGDVISTQRDVSDE